MSRSSTAPSDGSQFQHGAGALLSPRPNGRSTCSNGQFCICPPRGFGGRRISANTLVSELSLRHTFLPTSRDERGSTLTDASPILGGEHSTRTSTTTALEQQGSYFSGRIRSVYGQFSHEASVAQ